ncbi:SDR family oxidoreductase [Flavobacterium sp.]|jgi:NAD(P)-dependent dehydrogenase (short-subunit alcohol dehydrogenase family)|uniref:SDR family oxidoreductase n=1 Tax=Flavobacterium sp. TaxID=239 RepID=UPI0037BF76FE
MKKIALITGASKGLGFETALQLGKKGFTVIVTARTQLKSDEAATKLKTKDIDALGVQLDVNNSKDITNLVSFLTERFGKLDVLINNAGVQLDFPGFMPGNSTETVSMEILKQTFETNFFAPIALTQQLLPLLKKSDAGRIVNVSSIMGSLALHADAGSPIYGIKLLAYNSSKTALNQFTLHLAEALKDTLIKVNSAHPGWVKTDLGGEYAPMSIEDGVKTIVDLSTLDVNGKTGAFIHLGESLPW